MTDAGDKTILIAEDLKSDAKLIERAMKKAKVSNPLTFVTDGQQAIDYLAASGEYSDRVKYPLPVLILLDLKMPKRNGFDVLDWIRVQDGLKRLATVVLTSSSRALDVNRAYDLGANSYLVKPVASDALAKMFCTLDVYWLRMNTPPELNNNV